MTYSNSLSLIAMHTYHARCLFNGFKTVLSPYLDVLGALLLEGRLDDPHRETFLTIPHTAEFTATAGASSSASTESGHLHSIGMLNPELNADFSSKVSLAYCNFTPQLLTFVGTLKFCGSEWFKQ